MTLKEFFLNNPSGALAFSGGTDSSYLLWAAKQYGQSWRAYYVRTAFQPAFELDDAHRIASECGLPLTVIEEDILKYPEVTDNPPNRCYLCKRVIFSMIHERAEADGYSMLIDGTNASDDVSDRPGMKALLELGVRSPLRECGLTKADVRRLSREAGLFTWDKPSYACLATRVPTGTRISSELLKKAEEGERLLFSLGFRDFRIRLHGNAGVLQFSEEQLGEAFERREDIQKLLKPVFPIAAIDLLPRRSSLQRSQHMDTKQEILSLLHGVKEGEITPEDALLKLKLQPFEDLDYAKVDFHRGIRQGMSEVIFGQSKTPEQIAGILLAMKKHGTKNILVTRVAQETANYLAEQFPLEYSPMAKLARVFPEETEAHGSVVVATGGTSDMGVAEEAALTAEALGNRVTRLYDVGVAGLHRLLGNLEPLMSARAVIAVAGMEGALASVVGGLVDCPVIAVPTSVGYGASFGGIAALLSMLNSCASGVGVVNIDNGFGAGVLASRINHMGDCAE